MSKPSEAVTIEDLCLLANSFAELSEYDKAVAVYESACRLYPADLALRINLGRVRNLKREAFDSPADILPKERPAASKDLWANRYQGLGEIFVRNGRTAGAKQIFEISKVSNPNFFLPYFNLGTLYLRAREITPAVRELEQARRLNPFHETTVALLGDAYFEQREYQEALCCFVDALILSGEVSRHEGPYRNKIKEVIPKISGFTPKMRNDLIRERRNRINSLYEELETELTKILPEKKEADDPSKKTAVPEQVAEAVAKAEEVEREEARRAYNVAVQMKRHLIFRNMADEDVLKIARFTSEMQVLQGEFVYPEEDPVYGLYFVNGGKVELQKQTAFGPIVFSTFERGSFFGDDVLLSGRERFTGALAVQESDLLFLDKAGLANLFARERSIAIHFLWYFWKSLSLQIRESNDRMTSFFANTEEEPRTDRALGATGGKATHVEIDRKMEVLHAKGLSSKELSHIARLSNEETYNQGETIFHEGDLGDRLYIVLAGAVLISKKIPGAGDEALAVLRTGDFFGEMALVGQHHTRSADARAQEQGTTLLVISREALREILSIDTASAYQFLTILCRILSQRLLEMNEKVYQWRMMSGSFS
ncbi:MAG: cyclic nucleotide-binding domain-containing protein [Pseudomonadota bacterium]